MNKPTVHDIAKEAGVSLATVDRVLNARPGVRERTVAKVHAAVENLGYVRDTHAANLARKRTYRLAFVLPEGPSQFSESLKQAFKEVFGSQIADRVTFKMLLVPINDPHAIVRTLKGIQASHFDGVALMVPETPQVRDAIAHLKEEGVAVTALLSDLPNSQRDYFIGIDNVAAGRTAGMLMGRFVKKPGAILVTTTSIRSRDSLERRLGFDAVIGADFPDITVLPTLESYDDPRRMEEAVLEVVLSRPKLVGAYSMGSGNTPLLRALRRSGKLDDLVVIAHELTPATRLALQHGEVDAVISQNVGHLVRSSVRVLRSLCDQVPVFDAQEQVRIEIVTRENLP